MPCHYAFFTGEYVPSIAHDPTGIIAYIIIPRHYTIFALVFPYVLNDQFELFLEVSALREFLLYLPDRIHDG